jgi:peroxiredoxin/predicted 2-oxoglutarate/Fe(II)-dependent dioxygenase YbiX
VQTATNLLGAGEPAPAFVQRNGRQPRYAFDTCAGRYLVLCFYATGLQPHTRALLAAVEDRPDLFDDRHASFFGVSIDPDDETTGRIANRYPGYRHFWDFDLSVSRLYRVLPETASRGDQVDIRRIWVVIDPTMRVISVVPFREDQGDIAEVIALVASLPPPDRHAGFEIMAPILILPRVFEPEFCRQLIDLYEVNGGGESGVMRQIDGRTVGVHDHSFKRRKDHLVTDPGVIAGAQARILRRVVPEIAKVHQFRVTRMERYLVGCYSAEDGGHFAPHRDNTTTGTAHRRFAVSVNLNEDFVGGEVSFPEYGPRAFKAPTGGAVVFSCSLLHAVSKVTLGRRYAFLPFLYDDEAARLREANASRAALQGAEPEA